MEMAQAGNPAATLPGTSPLTAPFGLPEISDLAVARAGDLARETYESFLLLAITGFTLAGYIGLILLFVGVVR